MKDVRGLEIYGESLATGEKMPVLFIGHGSPMNAIDDNEFVRGFKRIAGTLPRPTSILCISAHWYTKGSMVTAMDIPRTIHDFYGFPPDLYEQQYPAKGNPQLAEDTIAMLKPVPVAPDMEWGLDHGTWSVLKHLYPDADVPVIQLSIDHTREAEYHFQLARQLQSLRSKGVLIIGSGNIVHNLGLVDWPNFHQANHGFDWAIEARAWVNGHILDGNFQALLHYSEQGKAMQLAVPSPDHYLPLVYTLGLADPKDDVELFNDKLQAGSMSMTSIKFA